MNSIEVILNLFEQFKMAGQKIERYVIIENHIKAWMAPVKNNNNNNNNYNNNHNYNHNYNQNDHNNYHDNAFYDAQTQQNQIPSKFWQEKKCYEKWKYF